MDPFHDVDVDPIPLASEDGEKVVCLTLSHTRTFSAPAGTVGNWSAVLFTTSLDEAQDFVLGRGVNDAMLTQFMDYKAAYSNLTTTGNSGYQLSSGILPLGPTTVWTYPSDVAQLLPGPAGSWVPPSYSGCWADTVLSTPSSSVSYRVTGGGFEIHNTTADLYKQGTLTVCRSSNRRQDAQNVFTGSFTNLVTGVQSAYLQPTNKVHVWPQAPITDFTIFQLPPANLQDALLQDALQWNAADGVMGVSVIDNTHNHFTSHAPMCVAVDSNMFSNSAIDDLAVPMPSTAVTALTSSPFYGQTLATTAGSFDVSVVAQNRGGSNHFTQRDNLSVYLTGLSLQTTFTVTTKYQVELKPRVFDSAYSITVPMLRSPPDYNLRSEMLSAHMQRGLPAGVPVGMNPSGEAWADIVSGIGNVAGLIGPLFGPVGAGIGTAASAAGKIASNVIRGVSQKKEATKAKKQVAANSSVSKAAIKPRK